MPSKAKKKEPILTAIEVDLETGRLGLAGGAERLLDGRPVLYHTVSRLLHVPGIHTVFLITSEKQAPRIRPLVEGLPVRFFICDEPDIPGRERLRRARRWSLSSWRGGLASAYFACEAGRPAALSALLRRYKRPFVLLAPAEAPLLCPDLVAQLLQAHRRDGSTKQLYVASAPPGLAADLYGAEILEVLRAGGRSVDGVLDFRPDTPEHYVDGLGLIHWYDSSLTSLRARLCADIDRSFASIERIVAKLGPGWKEVKARELAELLASDPSLTSGPYPQELVIELSGRRNHKGPIDGPPLPGADLELAVFEKVLEQLCNHRDMRLSVGVHGEPFLHPDAIRIFETISRKRPWALHVHTDGLAFDDRRLEALLQAEPDVVSITLDAAEPQTYHALHGIDGLETAERLCRTLAEKLIPQGRFVVPEFALCRQNHKEVEPFFDKWYPVTGWVVIRDHNDLAGQRPSHRHRDHVPPVRTACGHVLEELVLSPNGTFLRCLQDPWERDPLGSATEKTIEEVWAERAHTGPLCRSCSAWSF